MSEPGAGQTDPHEQDQIDARRATRAANLFDLRRMIGGLFLIYGAILFVLGLGASDAEIEKAAGINLNLWAGLGMLVLSGLFLLWAFTRPLSEELADAEHDEGDPAVGGAPAEPDAAALSGTLSAERPDRRDREPGAE